MLSGEDDEDEDDEDDEDVQHTPKARREKVCNQI
jgi:hypothetical protein